MNVKILSKLKPVSEYLCNRAAVLTKAERQLGEKIPPFFKSRAFTVSFYIVLSLTLTTLLVLNAGKAPAGKTSGEPSIAILNVVRGSSAVSASAGITDAQRPILPEYNHTEPKINASPSLIVNVTADNRTQKVWMNYGETVGDAIKKAGVSLGGDDTVNRSLSDAVYRDMDIAIQRIVYRTVVYKKTIGCRTVKTLSALLTIGRSKLMSKGSNGEYTVTAKVKYVDGVKKNEEILKQEVTKEPVSRKLLVGASLRAPVSKMTFESCALTNRGVPARYSRCVTGLATAYSARKGAGTASGMKAGVGRVAVNRKMFPYGTRLYIVGADGSFVYGYAVAADTGEFAKKGRVLVDLYFNSRRECCAFGAHRVKVYVLD